MKLTQKLADKVKSRKYEQLEEVKLPKVKKSNASVYRRLLYKTLE